MVRRLVRLGALLAALSAPLGVSAAQTPDGPTYLLTLAARVCPAYGDVTADLRRSNVQESLEDLGPDSPYRAGQPVDPAVEAARQPNCRPLPGWQFTLGWGVRGRSAGTDHLSTVTASRSPLTVQSSTPELDPDGNPTGRDLDGAVTVPIEGEDLDRALRGGSLWVQGGTPTDPRLDSLFPGRYGFGALRCAVDNLNGDNVEWVGYPTGSRHVFCFYYAVSPPPTAGTITVRRQVPAGRTDTQTFQFAGTVSYNPGGAFSVGVANGAPGSVDFVRAAGETWDFAEQPAPGWVLDSLACGSSTGDSTAAISGGRARVALVAGDHVTCTYTDRAAVTNLALFAQTVGGVGGPFTFTVTDPLGAITVGRATTSAENRLEAVGTVVDTVPGNYLVSETFPPGPPGVWTLKGVECNGRPVPAGGDPVLINVSSPAEPLGCSFTNRLRTGSITVEETTVGNSATPGFVIVPAAGAPSAGPPVLAAATPAENSPATATQVAGRPADGLPLGHYSVVAIGPRDSETGRWRRLSAGCGTAPVASPGGALEIDLTAARPAVACSFTHRFAPSAALTVIGRVVDPHRQRQGPVRIDAACHDSGGAGDSAIALTGPPGLPGPFRGGPVRFEEATTCSVREVASGAAPGAEVATRATLTRNGQPEDLGLPAADIRLAPGDDVVVEITGAYGRAAPAATTTGPPAGATRIKTALPRTDPGDPTGQLPSTGAGDSPGVPLAFLLAGGGLAMAALALYLPAAHRPRRHPVR